MQPVSADPKLAILAHLDVLDVRLDGGYELNRVFLAACRAMHKLSPARYATVVPDMILSRAATRGIVLDVDATELALAALEVGAAEAR